MLDSLMDKEYEAILLVCRCRCLFFAVVNVGARLCAWSEMAYFIILYPSLSQHLLPKFLYHIKNAVANVETSYIRCTTTHLFRPELLL